MSYNYIVSNQKPTAVSCCISGSFTSSTDLNVIIAKSTILEIYLITPEGLKLVKEFNVFGKIMSIQLFKSIYLKSAKKANKDFAKECLFLLTHKYNIAILECCKNPNGTLNISTRAYGSVFERIGRPSDTGMIVSIDPEGRAIGLRLYDGVYKLIKLDEQMFLTTDDDTPQPSDNISGCLASYTSLKNEIRAFNVNIEERKIIDIQFLDGFDTPMLALINQDSEGRHLRTYKLTERDLMRGPWNENNIEAEACILIPVPVLLGGGVIIIGQESIMYYRGGSAECSPFAIRPPAMKQFFITSHCKVDANGSRYLLGDMGGRLFMLILESENPNSKNESKESPPKANTNFHSNPKLMEDSIVAGGGAGATKGFHLRNRMGSQAPIIYDMKLEYLGEISIPESITYLDNGVVFIGSKLGDSQLIRLKSTPMAIRNSVSPITSSKNSPHGQPKIQYTYIEVLERFTNLGPIVDMLLMQADNSSYKDQLVTCSGAFKEGTIRILKDGIGLNKMACLELPTDGIKNIWPLKNSLTGHDSYLVLSIGTDTRVLAFEPSINPDAMTNIEFMNDTVVDTFGGGAEEIDIPGLITQDYTTLWCGNTSHNYVLQITTHSMRLIDRGASQLVHEWFPKTVLDNDDQRPLNPITLASSNGDQSCIVSGNQLYYLEVGLNERRKGEIKMIANRQFSHEISCIDVAINDFSSSQTTKSHLCAVGFWGDLCIEVLQLETLETLHKEILPNTNIIPRSIIMCRFEGDNADFVKPSSKEFENGFHIDNEDTYLFVALGDGTLYHYNMDPIKGSLRNRKSFVIGTRPPAFKLFPLKPSHTHVNTPNRKQQTYNVIICSDRPAIIYKRNKKLFISDLNMEDLNTTCSFDSPEYPNSIILIPNLTSGQILIGKIDEIRKLHIRTIPLYESPRRIAYQKSSQTFAVLTTRIDVYNGFSYGPAQSNAISLRAANHSNWSNFNSNSSNGSFPHKSSGFQPYGDASNMGASYGDENEAHSLVILDQNSWEPLWAHHFQPYEFATSLINCHLAVPNTINSIPNDTDTPYLPCTKEYYVVGTAMVYPEESEPRHGRILIFEFTNQSDLTKNNESIEKSRKLILVSDKEVLGAPYSMCQFPSHETFLLQKSQIDDTSLHKDKCDTSVLDNNTNDKNSVCPQKENSTTDVPAKPHPPKLLVSLNSAVRLFEWVPEYKELRLDCSHFNNILALYLKTMNDCILIGDLMRSLTLLKYKPMESCFEEIARDYNPAWTSAVEIIDSDTYLAAENSYNLYICSTSQTIKSRLANPINMIRDPKSYRQSVSTKNVENDSSQNNASNQTITTPTTGSLLDDERKHLFCVALFHLAEFVNVFRKGSLISNKNTVGDNILQTGNPILMGTISGSIHLMFQLPPALYYLLECLKLAINKVVPSLGRIDQETFRAFYTEQKTEKSYGFIDGDLVETFLDLESTEKNKVMEEMKSLLTTKYLFNSDNQSSEKSKNPKTDRQGEEEKDSKFEESFKVSQITMEDLNKLIEELARTH